MHPEALVQKTKQVKRLSKNMIQSYRGKFERLSESGSGIVFVYYKRETRHCIGSFYTITRKGKKPKWVQLGRYPSIDIDTAKEKARLVNARMDNDTSVNASLSHYDTNTVGQILELYLKSVEVDAESASESRLRNINSAIKNHLSPRIGHYDYDVLCPAFVLSELYQPMMRDKYKLSYITIVIRTLASAYRYVTKLQLIEHNPISTLRLDSMTTIKVKPKAMCIETYELKDAIASIKQKRCIKTRMQSVLMLMYATRLDETVNTLWSQFDFDDCTWIVREEMTKTDSRHVLPLTDYAIDILKTYKRLRRKTNNRGKALFPAKHNPRAIMNSTYACKKVSDGNNFSSHDFRKVARSWWQQHGIDYYIGEVLLNHKKAATDEAYIQSLLFDQCKIALDKWHAHLFNVGLKEVL